MPIVKKKYKKKKTKTGLPKPVTAQIPNLKMPKLELPEENPTPPSEIPHLTEHDDDDEDIPKDDEDDHQGPEAGEEPIGPDQSLPVSSSDVLDLPPQERKVTSYVNVSCIILLQN